jgi:Asp-tRNA(Asn)/Glu-tRNA(Gln) amidotransferase A subunit family amidase
VARRGRAGALPIALIPGQTVTVEWPWRSTATSTRPAPESTQPSTHEGATLTCTNLTGHPTVVLPVGSSERDAGRPTVLALVGRLYGEAELLAVAEHWQAGTGFHRLRPALTS